MSWGVFHRDIWNYLIRMEPALCKPLSLVNKSMRQLVISNAEQWVEYTIRHQMNSIHIMTYNATRAASEYKKFGGIGVIFKFSPKRYVVDLDGHLAVTIGLLIVKSRACRDHHLLRAIADHVYTASPSLYTHDCARHLRQFYGCVINTDLVIKQPSMSLSIWRWLGGRHKANLRAEIRKQKSRAIHERLNRLRCA